MSIGDNGATQVLKVMLKIHMCFQVYYWLQAIAMKETEFQDNHNKIN